LFTLSFPYYVGGENTFLQYELEYLVKQVSCVTILPATNTGKQQEISQNIIVDHSLAEYSANSKFSLIHVLTKVIFSTNFIKELVLKPSLLVSLRKLKKTIAFLNKSIQIKEWAEEYFLKTGQMNGNILLYTYWCTQTTLGLGLFKKNRQNIKLISRAHGIDLFEERGAVFCRSLTIGLLDFVYLASQNGRNYLISKYPEYNSKFKFSGLGVKAPSCKNNASSDGCMRIVSCSSVDLNKRVDLIFKSLIVLSKENPALKVFWFHFGDGPLKAELEDFIARNKSDNVKSTLKGWVSNDEILDFYCSQPIDLFITTSSSEGGRPVSIQEAQSFGIPVIGTNVGGIPEIVNATVGKIISSDPSPEELAEAINSIMENPDKFKDMRRASIVNWEENFNADICFSSFAESIRLIVES
jgi:glycosyltransferase involved in cell wall biosynthesis